MTRQPRDRPALAVGGAACALLLLLLAVAAGRAGAQGDGLQGDTPLVEEWSDGRDGSGGGGGIGGDGGEAAPAARALALRGIRLRHQDSWLPELLFAGVAALYIANIFVGKARNRARALAWTKQARAR